MKTVMIANHAGTFAENKDTARELRLDVILPALEKGEDVVLDFADVTGATQSFVHALISDLFRKFGSCVLDRVTFKNCNATVRRVVSIVADYMQEAEG